MAHLFGIFMQSSMENIISNRLSNKITINTHCNTQKEKRKTKLTLTCIQIHKNSSTTRHTNKLVETIEKTTKFQT